MVINGDDHTVGVSPAKLRKLCDATSALLQRKHVTGLEMARCVGHWTWAMLIARPALSVFNAVYRFIIAAGPIPFEIWRSVRRELWTAIRLAPLFVASLSIDWFHSVVASDASLTGQGVCAAPLTGIGVDVAAAASARSGVLWRPDEKAETQLNSALIHDHGHRWRTIIAAPFRRSEHINELELRSVCTTVRWVLTSPHSIERRLLLLCDSQVAVGALTKGRTSAHSLLRRLRPTAALLLASGIRLSMRWIPSALNPADGPSRRYQFDSTLGYPGEGPSRQTGHTFTARRKRRQLRPRGDLRGFAVEAGTRKTYQAATLRFLEWAQEATGYGEDESLMIQTEADLDGLLTEYIQFLYESGGSKAAAKAAKAGLCLYFPYLRPCW